MARSINTANDVFGIDFTEASTWRGVVMVLGACGVPFEPQAAEYFIAAGMGLSGLIGVFFRRKSKPGTV